MKNHIIALIDDDNIQHYIIQITLKKIHQNVKLMSFLDGSTALDYLKSLDASNAPDFILLDLDMPNISGWDFLNIYQKFEHKSDIYIVTSSIDIFDIKKSQEYNEVKQFISKPLNAKKINLILDQYN